MGLFVGLFIGLVAGFFAGVAAAKNAEGENVIDQSNNVAGGDIVGRDKIDSQ